MKPLSTSIVIEGENVAGKALRDKRQNDLESKRGSRVFEHIFRDTQAKQPLGLSLLAAQLSVETHGGRRQTFWAAFVKSNNSGVDRIQVGDVLLYVHTNLCVLDASQARSGVEFTRAVAAIMSTAANPRAVRFARLDSLRDDVEDDTLQSFYALGKVRVARRCCCTCVHGRASSRDPCSRTPYPRPRPPSVAAGRRGHDLRADDPRRRPRPGDGEQVGQGACRRRRLVSVGME
jgi:hypothetical protein